MEARVKTASIHRHARLMPSRKSFDERRKKNDIVDLGDFVIRPPETLIPTLDLRTLVDMLPNEGED